MPDGYKIKTVRLNRQKIKVLGSDLVQKETFLEILANNPKSRTRAQLIAQMMVRIDIEGVEWACQGDKLKSIGRYKKSPIRLYELRIPKETIRVMTYIHSNNGIHTPIYLFDFNGHQGTNGQVSKRDKKKGDRLAHIAKRCIEEK